MVLDLIDDILGFGGRHGTEPLFGTERPKRPKSSVTRTTRRESSKNAESFMRENRAYAAVMLARMSSSSHKPDYASMREEIGETLDDIFTQAQEGIPAIADLDSVRYSMEGEKKKYHSRFGNLVETGPAEVASTVVSGLEAYELVKEFVSEKIGGWEDYANWRERTGHPHGPSETLYVASWNVSKTLVGRKPKLTLTFEVDEPGNIRNVKSEYRFEITRT